MKKLILFAGFVLLTSSAAFAQAQVGLRAGLNVATVNDGIDAPEGIDEPWRTGLIIGLASSFHLGEMFAIAPELNYTQRGSKQEGSVAGIDVTTEARYNYLELPILFRISFGEVLKGYLNAGPNLAYWLGGNVDEEDFDFDETDVENRLEIGGAVGGGIQLDTEAGSFLIDLRYTAGFTDLYDIDDDPAFEGFDKFKNQVVSASLIFLVPTIR